MTEKGFTVAGEILNRMIERVIHAVSQDMSRLALTGVLWEFDKSEVLDGGDRRSPAGEDLPRRRKSRLGTSKK